MQMTDQPAKLAADFKKTLSGWRRSTRHYGYREAGAFGRRLEQWQDQVARELLPRDPSAALASFEAFITADRYWFDSADDSDGAIGDAMRSACTHWLQAAARCPVPKGGWTPRLIKLYRGDGYGARETLLQSARILLDETAQRGLVAHFESLLSQAVAAPATIDTSRPSVYQASAALSLLSESLRDPDIKVRATMRYSPNPNPMQRQSFVQAFLDADRPSDALAWLQDSWGPHDGSRQSLLAQVLERLGRFIESTPIRQDLFERSLSTFDFQQWLEHIAEPERAEASARARQLGLEHDNLIAAAKLLVQLGDAEAAESRLLKEHARINGEHYSELVPLAKALRAQNRTRGEAVVYRALVLGILNRGYAKAYSHAARYWARLTAINETGIDLAPLSSHKEFEAEVRLHHGRKSSFWAQVKANPGSRADDEDDDLPL